MIAPEPLDAGFKPNCDDCQEAVRRVWEACAEHYVARHERDDPRRCRTCGGTERLKADACRRCRAAGVV